MQTTERKYSKGDIIFREGEPSSSAFMIVTGQVGLFKKKLVGTKLQMIKLETLSSGDMIGEMGIFDHSARSSTARALGSVKLNVIKQDSFREALKDKPEVALNVINNLAERLRHSAEMVASPVSGGQLKASKKILIGSGLSNEKSLTSISVQKSLWDSILGLFKKSTNKRYLLEFRVSRLKGDKEGIQTTNLVRALSKQRGANVKAYHETVVGESKENNEEVSLNSSLFSARELLEKDNADLLVWGEVNEIGSVINLRFTTINTHEDHPGSFLISDQLALPLNFSSDLARLLCATAVASVVPSNETQRLLIKPLLLPALDFEKNNQQEPPKDLILKDQISIQICYANIIALIGYYMHDLNLISKAAKLYQENLEMVSKETDRKTWANILFHLCRIRQLFGEKSGDIKILTDCINNYQNLLEEFVKDDYPQEWAAIQYRLGNTFYHLDDLRGETAELKNSIQYYQRALQVYSKFEDPKKWGDIKNSLGRALQVWGDLARSPKIIDKAISECNQSLQVRSMAENPILWAATKNNIGSAMFLRGRIKNNEDNLNAAIDAFDDALKVYRSYDAKRLIRITERNLSKVENLKKIRLAKATTPVLWQQKIVGDGNKLSRPISQGTNSYISG